MKFEIEVISGQISKYADIIGKYNMTIEEEFKKAYPTDRKLTKYIHYYIDINNLEELMNFINQINKTKQASWIRDGILLDEGIIEIYDDYME